MRDRPEGRRLLEQARRSLLEELLPALPADKRYTALMIANAMGVAAREIVEGDRVRSEEGAALAAFLGDEAAAAAEAEALLAAAIRAGRHDGEAALHRLLEDSAVRRQRINNPKSLRSRGAG